MKSKKRKKNGPAPKGSLENLLNQSEKIREEVEEAATDLSSVNEILKQGSTADISVETIQDAITQNEDVEQKVAQAADDLEQVNSELASEVAAREVIEAELADTQAILANVLDDLSESQANEQETRKTALHDPLTGLPNRVLFEQALEHGLAQAKRHGWGLAVLFIDLDQFKSINDSHGHGVGDEVLVVTADHLRSSIREQDTVSRWGGDEFVCLLLEVKQAGDVLHLAEKMVKRIARTYDLNGVNLSVSVSIGIAIYPADGETAETLINNADTAMYQAKGSGQRVVLFS